MTASAEYLYILLQLLHATPINPFKTLMVFQDFGDIPGAFRQGCKNHRHGPHQTLGCHRWLFRSTSPHQNARGATHCHNR